MVNDVVFLTMHDRQRVQLNYKELLHEFGPRVGVLHFHYAYEFYLEFCIIVVNVYDMNVNIENKSLD